MWKQGSLYQSIDTIKYFWKKKDLFCVKNILNKILINLTRNDFLGRNSLRCFILTLIKLTFLINLIYLLSIVFLNKNIKLNFLFEDEKREFDIMLSLINIWTKRDKLKSIK